MSLNRIYICLIACVLAIGCQKKRDLATVDCFVEGIAAEGYMVEEINDSRLKRMNNAKGLIGAKSFRASKSDSTIIGFWFSFESFDDATSGAEVFDQYSRKEGERDFLEMANVGASIFAYQFSENHSGDRMDTLRRRFFGYENCM